MYVAHHSGSFIRLAYADSLRGPWTVHDGPVLPVDQQGIAGADLSW